MLSPFEWQAILLSVKVASVAVIFLLPIGLLLAWLLSRAQFVGKETLEAIIYLPLVLPPVVIGYLLLILMGKRGVIGQWLHQYFDLVFSFNWKGASLACAVISLPLMVRSIRLSLDLIDRQLELAAITLGASKLKMYLTITLPLALPGIITGTMLSFARSLGEFGATITFVANIPGQTQTIPLALFNLIESPGSEWQAMRLCVISVLISLLSLLLSEWLNRRMSKKIYGQ